MKSLADLVFFLVFLPLASSLLFISLGFISLSGANVLMSVCHLALLAITSLYFMSQKSPSLRKVSGRARWAPLFFPLLVLLLAMSVLLNNVDAMPFFRSCLTVIFLLNFLILYPFMLAQTDYVSVFFERLIRIYVIFSVGLMILAATLYMIELSPYYRLGFPLRPGVFAYYMLIAWLVTLIYKKHSLLNAAFAVSIVLSGSRSSTLLMAFFFVCYILFTHRDKAHRRIVLVGLWISIVPFLFLLDEQLLRPYLIERQDISAGRFSIWEEAYSISRETDTLLFGSGSPQEIEFYEDQNQRTVGAHNSFLDLTLSYGILFALFAYLTWFVHFFPSKRTGNTTVYQLQIALFISVTCRSFISNTFWLNMGDAATLFIMLVLLCPASKVRKLKVVKSFGT